MKLVLLQCCCYGLLWRLGSTHDVVEYLNPDGSTTIHDGSLHNNEDRSASLPSSDPEDSSSDDHHEEEEEDHHHLHTHDHADGGGCRFHRLSKSDELADEFRMTAWRAKRHDNLFLRGKPQQYIIPVYVHVVQPNFFWGYQSDEDIAAALAYLNDAFAKAKTPFVFQHKATTRTINAKWGEHCGDEDAELEFKRALKKGGADTLNLYMCNKIVDDRGSTLNGYAFAPFPGSNSFPRDGVVVAGRGSPQHNTIVHEVGHFMVRREQKLHQKSHQGASTAPHTHRRSFSPSCLLFLQGLFHTFGTSCLEKDGDQVNDTPVHTNRFAYSIANCNVSKVIPWDSCPNAAGKDPLDNYMSYVRNSECRSNFTKGQVERMLGQYELYRNKGPKIVVVPPAACLAFLGTCKVDSDCCGKSRCVFFTVSNRRLCWL
jgi:Pregnancy-associated plasma protein-A